MQTASHSLTPGQRWWPFLALCAVGALRWSVADRFPATAPSLLSLGLGIASASLVAFTLALRNRPAGRVGPGRALLCGLAGVLMLCGPYVTVLAHARTIEPAALTLALALVPVVIAVARPAFRETESADIAGRLWPGIAAMAGLLLILPEPGLGNGREDILLGCVPLTTGIGAVWFRTQRELPRSLRAAIALSAAAVVLFGGALLNGGVHELAWRNVLAASAFDAVQALLSVLALLRMGGTRWSAQFEIIPLALLLEGLLGMGYEPDARALAGLILVLLGSVFLLLPPRPERPEELVPKG